LLGGDVWEYAEDFDLELFDAITLEDSAADAVKAGTDIAKREEGLGRDWKATYKKECWEENEGVEANATAQGSSGWEHGSGGGQIWLREILCD
jgi:hypothetical protein